MYATHSSTSDRTNEAPALQNLHHIRRPLIGCFSRVPNYMLFSRHVYFTIVEERIFHDTQIPGFAKIVYVESLSLRGFG